MTVTEFLVQNGGIFMGFLAVAIAVIFSGMGSARGVGLAGEACAAVVIDEPNKFAQTLLFQLLPGTQGLYGFVIGLLITLRLTPAMTLASGLMFIGAALPVAIVGLVSAPAQGKVAVAGINILIKNQSQIIKGVIYAVMVETYAILAFVISIILVLRIPA